MIILSEIVFCISYILDFMYKILVVTHVCFAHTFLDLSRTALDNSGRECFTRYISNSMPLLYLFCRLCDIFVYVS